MVSRVFFSPLPPADPSHHDEATDIFWSTCRPLGLLESEVVSITELIRVIRRLWVAAALDFDKILVLCLRKCLMTLLPWILRFFNASLSLDFFHKACRRAKVIPLRKLGEGAYDIPRAYRPTSLLSSVRKIVEPLINYRIIRRLEGQHALTPFQFGFRAGKEVLDGCT